MAAKSDPQNLGSDSGLSQCQSLLELSSGPPGTVPLPGISFAQLKQSNNIINDIVLGIFLLLTVSAPAVRVPRVSAKWDAYSVQYIVTDLHRPQIPHFLLSFLP